MSITETAVPRVEERIEELLKSTKLPRLVPEPIWCTGINKPVICLDGTWEVKDLSDGKMYEVCVPYDMSILHRGGLSSQYEYCRKVSISDAGFTKMNDEYISGREVSDKDSLNECFVLRFEGINGLAAVYINDVKVAVHQNGFITWNCDITDILCWQRDFELKIVVDEDADNVSSYSRGGILHSVFLYRLPQAYINSVYLSPLFDEDMESCILRTDLDISAREAGEYSACINITDPYGNNVLVKSVQLKNKSELGYYIINIPIQEPVLWDAEHPMMYLAEIELYQDGQLIERTLRKTGLRKIERTGNHLFVNQKEVKLHGCCRHEISPRSGRALTRELIRQDAAMFKEANCNYIRTSHYPPSEYFLEQCDEKGIYVEDELALAFVAKSLPYTQRDPAYTDRYISLFTETLARDYNHPSVIIWSLCNESFGGYNFDLLNRFIHRKDPTRMTKFSYPMTIREEHEMPDIWSIHYSEYDTDLAKKRDNVSVGYAPGRDMPVLHDEYAHVPCYNREEMRRDPAVRSFWGQGIIKFWDKIWNTPGALGGAIWAGIDDTDIYDNGNTDFEWGIMDVWRRKKPEFYMTRKAYSPIKVIHSELWPDEKKILLILENRFCHTDFDEVTLKWSVLKDEENTCSYEGELRLPQTVTGAVRKIVISLKNVPDSLLKPQSEVFMNFTDSCGNIVDEIIVNSRERLGRPAEKDMDIHGEIMFRDEEKETIIEGKDFCFTIDKENGLISGLWKRESDTWKRVLIYGPVLNVPYMKLGEWELLKCTVTGSTEEALVVTEGSYEKTLKVCFEIKISPDGTFITKYSIYDLQKALPYRIKMRVGVDVGGLDELGIFYLADPSMDTFTWQREKFQDEEGYISWYPEDHISRNRGTAHRFATENIWGEQPVIPWSQDTKDDILYGRFDVKYKGTNDFRSTKEKLSWGRLYNEKTRIGITVMKNFPEKHYSKTESDAAENEEIYYETNVRLEVTDPQDLKILDSDDRIKYTGKWYLMEDKKESDHGTEMWSREKGATAECEFTGTGIVWYGSQDAIYGKANVYIDGKLSAEGISQRSGGADLSCSSVGFDKKYHLPIFSVDNLQYGKHTIRIEVLHEKAPDSSDFYIVIDYFRILTGENVEPVKLIINQDFSFPHISWGNYRKPPIMIEEGTCGIVSMKI